MGARQAAAWQQEGVASACSPTYLPNYLPAYLFLSTFDHAPVALHSRYCEGHLKPIHTIEEQLCSFLTALEFKIGYALRAAVV